MKRNQREAVPKVLTRKYQPCKRSSHKTIGLKKMCDIYLSVLWFIAQ